MEQGPSWDANRFSASQEIPRILCNPQFYNHIHTCPPPVSILGQNLSYCDARDWHLAI